jgi:hypothetical protein
MPDLQTALQDALIKTTINAWDVHEDQIRKTQQEKQMANPNPVVTLAEGHKGFGTSNNVMRATFDAVKNAPKMTHKEYVEMLALNGYKRNSTNSVLYQLMRVGQIARDEHGQLSVTQDEYVPIKAPVKKQSRVLVLDKAPEPKPRQIVIVRRKPKEEQGIAALKADTALPDVEKFDMGKFTHHAPSFHPSAIVDGLTVLHARELYDYLKKIFGGN